MSRREPWLPGLAALGWWVTFYPGLFSEDSIINLSDARSGQISVWFTAWWVYVVDGLSLGTTAIPLLTLVSALGLGYATYLWIATVFPVGPARAATVLVVCAIPLVGATGIQVRHDVGLACGLLLCAVVLTRTWTRSDRFALADFGMLALAMPLIATRHNGMPTLLASAAVVLITGRHRWRQSLALLAVAGGAALFTMGATRASGNSVSVDPIQTVEWLMGDISCALTKGAEPTDAEWAVLTRMAPRERWPQPRACRAMNPLLTERLADASAIVPNYGEMIGVWRSLGMRFPLVMIRAHATRVRLFLPPLVTGVADMPTFLHSTIEPNDFGLAWRFPSIANYARTVIRAWNLFGIVLANAALWLMVLIAVAWRWPAHRQALAATMAVAIALDLGLLAAAPISEGRYGLFILICGQATLVYRGFAAADSAPGGSTNGFTGMRS